MDTLDMMDNAHKADDANGDLFSAAQRGEVGRVTALLAAADTREITVQEEMHGALQIAIRNDFPAVVRVLCAAGAQFGLATHHIRFRFQPIHLAASVGSASCIAEFASHVQISARACDSFLDSPLHWACRCAHADAIRELLAAKARVGDYNNHWNTPLDVAVFFGHARCVKVLVASRLEKRVLEWAIHQGRYCKDRRGRISSLLDRALRLHTQSAKTVE